MDNKLKVFIMDIASMRKDYKMKNLSEEAVIHDPMQQFKQWFEESIEAQVPEPNAMILATCSPEAKPSARVMLLKGVTPEGFIFFTNYESRKGLELAQNPQASVVFLWLELERQVRIEGVVKKVTREESEQYFYSRPFESQVSAMISPQSKAIEGKLELEALHKKTTEMYLGAKVPFPDHWGGFLLCPTTIEFWQGRESRFHDRIQFTKKDAAWSWVRLAP